MYHARNAKMRTFEFGNEVFIHNFGIGSKWFSGVIANENGPLTWIVKVGYNKSVNQHAYYL